MLKVIELFSGIGAQRKALERAGIPFDVVAISEIDKYALKVYEKMYGEFNNLGDITKIEKLPKADLWTYSFPCTDISVSGKLKGLEKGSGTRSSLLWEVERLINVSKECGELPKYLLMENVKNLVSKRFKKYFDTWCSYLESLGYTNYYKVLNAKDYGIPQNRERVFMISILNDTEGYTFPKAMELKTKLSDLLEEKVDEKYYLSEKLINCFTDMTDRNGLFRGLKFRPRDLTKDFIAKTITTKAGSRPCDNYIVVPEATKTGYALAEVGDGIYTNRCSKKRGVVQKNKIPTLKANPSDIGVVVNDDNNLIAIRKLTPRECFRLMGFLDNEIDLAFSSSVSDTQLYKMAGNSIVVNCLTEIFKNLKGDK